MTNSHESKLKFSLSLIVLTPSRGFQCPSSFALDAVSLKRRSKRGWIRWEQLCRYLVTCDAARSLACVAGDQLQRPQSPQHGPASRFGTEIAGCFEPGYRYALPARQLVSRRSAIQQDAPDPYQATARFGPQELNRRASKPYLYGFRRR